MHTLVPRTLHYLHESLGAPMSAPRIWPGQDGLPYFLRDAFDLQELEILGTPVLLALDSRGGQPPLGDIRTWIEKIRSLAGLPAIYVTQALASYERKRLIEQKVPFIVPGNQLYLPDLGLDLREYFRQRQGSAETPLSPSAQALLITALLRPVWKEEWAPAEMASQLGYTAMTVSRATRELVAAGLAQARKAGRTQYLVMVYAAQQTWERAAPLLRSPVQRTVWTASPIPPDPSGHSWRWAGLSALARQSMLGEPRMPVHAIGRTEWQVFKSGVDELPEAMPGAHEWQLWNYSPALEPDSDTVDPLSLILSLRDSTDERIEIALDALKEKLPW